MRDVRLDFHLSKEADKFRVHLTGEGQEAEALFAFDFSERLGRVLRDIEEKQCSLDVLRDIGSSLWAGLLAGAVGALFDSLRRGIGHDARFQLRLCLPTELESLPWEALYDAPGAGFVSCHPRYSLLRQPEEEITLPSSLLAVSGRLKILAVIPSGSGLNVEQEWHDLDLAVSQMKDRVQLERLSGSVVPDRLGRRLRDEHWDVVHFIGHGQMSQAGRPLIRFNSDSPGEDELMMNGEAFAGLFNDSSVRLVVLNCCYGGQSATGRTLSGLGPLLLRAGVPATVAMRFEVTDRVALRFSDQFYQSLIQGAAVGRIDLAVEHARESIFRNQSEDAARDFITPVLFLLAGRERLFDLDAPPPPIVRPPQPSLASAIDLPEELVEALRGGLCVPVIGQRVLTTSGIRSGPPLPGPRQIARDLVAKLSHPLERDFELCEAAGDWMDVLLFQWVCQYYAARRSGDFYKVARTIQNAYRTRPPLLLESIATWDVPGIFYLYFDGLLEAAFDLLSKGVRPVYGVDRPVPAGPQPLLVHVRGSHREADSLVLTEQDHDRLWDAIGRMTPEIAELVRGHIGRSLLFLGVNPRDPLVKRLTTKLLEQTSLRNLGPVFFACRPGEKADPYWEALSANCSVTWIEGDLDDLVSALTSALERH